MLTGLFNQDTATISILQHEINTTTSINIDKLITDRLIYASTLKEIGGEGLEGHARISQVSRRYAWITSLYRMLVVELPSDEVMFIPPAPKGVAGSSMALKDRELLACKFGADGRQAYFLVDRDYIVFVVPDGLKLGKGEVILSAPIIEV